MHFYRNLVTSNKVAFLDSAFIKYCASVVCALITAAFVCSTSAQGQGVKIYYECRNGPGPGEVEHHREPEYDNNGRVYGYLTFCVAADEATSQQPHQVPPRRPQFYTDAYYAVVWHPEANKVWASYKYRNLADAKKDSLANCTKTMGKGCAIAVSGVNQIITIYDVADGSLKWVVSRMGEGREQTIKECWAIRKPCYLANTIDSKQIGTNVGDAVPDMKRSTSPENTEELRNRYGAIAWTGGETIQPLVNKIWVSGGQKNRSEAEKAALALCQKSMVSAPGTCTTAIAIANGVMIVWIDKQKNIQFYSDVALPVSSASQWEYYNKICKSKKPKCTLKFLIDARMPGEFEKDVF